ncbi:NAD(P)-binding protein [Rhodocollybia butyracea]|uniref:NAD(P)-binding protein n=1 Tax=Rhodocollybia butyracea TaxID=206335 RepID=A0A9P5PRD0_9AGAR|nr:NAD(P)-binding protein [Rhodocollybia butyracea]
MSSYKPVIIIAGVGSGEGTGGATARAFAKEGYSVAVASFIISSYEYASIQSTFKSIRARYPLSQYSIRAALYNCSDRVRKPFLEITPEDIKTITRVNFEGAFAFVHEIISDFIKNEIDQTNGKRDFLAFTGSTYSLAGYLTTSASSMGKFAMRGLSQSLAKEFGKQNIHVAHVRISLSLIEVNEDLWLTAEAVASSYLHLAKQERSAWTWELNLRPAQGKD